MYRTTNRIRQYLEGTANADKPGDNGTLSMAVKTEPANNGTKNKPERTAFGKRVAEIMATAGFGTPKQIETGLSRGRKEAPFSYSQIYDLFYAADPASVNDLGKRAPLVSAIASLAGVPVSAFFSDEPADSVVGETVDSELVEKAVEALAGPKREFLADAIEMAHQALAASRSHYRRHS